MSNRKFFTKEYPAVSKVLLTPCGISNAFDPRESEATPIQEQIMALWDTGAAGSVVSKCLAEKLTLVPYGEVTCQIANGEYITSIYYVSLLLPNGVVIPALRVTEGNFTGFDMLIGMDIITQGDFAISHANGKTKFTFQIPSVYDLDFSKE